MLFAKKKEVNKEEVLVKAPTPNDNPEKMAQNSFNDSEAKEEIDEDVLKNLSNNLKDIQKEIEQTELSINKIDKDLEKVNKVAFKD